MASLDIRLGDISRYGDPRKALIAARDQQRADCAGRGHQGAQTECFEIDPLQLTKKMYCNGCRQTYVVKYAGEHPDSAPHAPDSYRHERAE